MITKKNRTYQGCNKDELEQALFTVCALSDEIDMTDLERKSMDIAAHAISSIMSAMDRRGKVKFD